MTRMVDADDLVGALEMADLLGCSRSGAYLLAGAPGFPAPVATLGKVGRLWLGSEILAWRAANPPARADHGTPGMYGRHRCRCDACRSANTARMRQYRTRRAAA